MSTCSGRDIFRLSAEKEVLSFTETKLVEEDIELNLREKKISVLVEILENVAKHSPGKGTGGKYGMPVLMIMLETMLSSPQWNILNENVEDLKE